MTHVLAYLLNSWQATFFVLRMFVLYILSVSLWRGMALNALLMSIVAKSGLCAGLFELMPSKMCCVRLVSKVFCSVVVETCVVWEQGETLKCNLLM